MRISSPPTVGPCHYGIDTPTREELIASSRTPEQIREFVGADSLGYLSLEGLYDSVERRGRRTAGRASATPASPNNYPITIQQPARLRQLRLISALGRPGAR